MPMLNVFIAIIPLLLLSAAFVQVAVIQASLPAAAATAAEPVDGDPLDLEVFILRDAYVVRGHGLGTQTVPRPDADGDDPTAEAARAQLSELLKGIAAAHPDNHEVRIVSEGGTRYDEIIRVMDLSRAAGLPEASLAGGGDS
jgi:biopolymer transport protein ExbD